MPLILFSIGLIVLIGSVVSIVGMAGIKWAALYVGGVLVIEAPFTIVGMYVLGTVLGISSSRPSVPKSVRMT